MEKNTTEERLPRHMQNLPKMPKGIRMRILEDRVLVLPCDPEKKSKGGIIIPETAQEKPHRGLVVKVGPGDSREDSRPMTLKEGMVILYGKYSGSECDVEDEEGNTHDMLLMRQTDIAAELY